MAARSLFILTRLNREVMAISALRGGRDITGDGGLIAAVPRQFTAGNALRGVAAMSVLALHASVETLIAKRTSGFTLAEQGASHYRALFGSLAPAFLLTRAGIYVFFALSGYLLTRTFLAAYTLRTPRPSVSRYVRNRALRIIPAFWVVTTVYVLWNHAEAVGGAGGLLAVYGFAQNYHWSLAAEIMPQAWTLDIEISFYVLIPVAALLAFAAPRARTPARRMWVVLAVLLVLYILSLIAKHGVGSPINHTYTIASFLFAFIPGVALAAVEPFAARHLRDSDRGRIWARGALGLGVALLAAFCAVAVTNDNIRVICASLGCGALVAAPLIWQWSTGGCWRLLDNGVMHWLGTRSYGIYLIHLGLMGHVLNQIGSGHSVKTTFLLLLVATTILTLIAADLLWRMVERPALQRRLPWRQAEFARPAPTGADS